MAAQFARAPHRGVTSGPAPSAPNAALLIDFDNVTMGIRSDLSKELKNLLNSDIIKGKVAVQRAYADWRRYPQYIVPLAEASIDLIFAPAYGSSKKNATDIRLAIDALELVFTRPEIGTFIILSGDSDFSSLVLKLKEYGKYVIGVGMRDSASDLLVQNCDEYYSYSALTGLTKEDDTTREASDPWMLAEKAVKQMAAEGDVMRSDRLKQVMLELDPNFNEKELGYSKFSKFLMEAAARGCLSLKKGENGQWEVAPVEKSEEEALTLPEPVAEREARAPREEGRRSRARGRGRGGALERLEEAASERAEPVVESASPTAEAVPSEPVTAAADSLAASYALLRRAVESVTKGGGPARDSDVKRRMLELDPTWDESIVGFSKFSRFLRQAHDAEVIDLHKTGNGVYEVTLAGGRAGKGDSARSEEARPRAEEARKDESRATKQKFAKADTAPAKAEEPAARAEEPSAKPDAASAQAAMPSSPANEPAKPADTPAPAPPVASGPTPTVRRPIGVGIGFRPGMRRIALLSGPPPLLPGQAVRPKGFLNGKTTLAAGSAPAPAEAAATSQPAPAEAPATPQPASAEAAVTSQSVPVEAAATMPSAPAAQAATPAEAAASSRTPARAQKGSSGVKESPEAKKSTRAKGKKAEEAVAGAAEAVVEPELAGLPTDAEGVIAYLTGRYKGVGVKTAEAAIAAFGADGVFRALYAEPERVREVLGQRRAEALLKGWESDLAQRRAEAAAKAAAADKSAAKQRSEDAAATKASVRTAQTKPSAKAGSSQGRSAARKSGSSRKGAAAAKTEAGAPDAAVDISAADPTVAETPAAGPETVAPAAEAVRGSGAGAPAPKKSSRSRSRGRRGGRKRGTKVEAGGD